MATQAKKISVTETFLKRRLGNPNPSQTLAIGDGLYLRISPLGAITFFFRFQLDGSEKTINVGKYPTLSLLDAKKVGVDLRRQHANQSLRPVSQKVSVDDIFQQYIDKVFAKKNLAATVVFQQRFFETHVPDVIRFGDANLISAMQWSDLFESLTAHAAPSANKLLRTLKNAYRRAIKLELIQVDKISLFGASDFGITAVSRTRFFDVAELREFFSCINDPAFDVKKRAYFKLLLLLGARKSEYRLSRYSDFRMKKNGFAVWISCEHKTVSKTQKPIVRTMTPYMLSLVDIIEDNHPTEYFLGDFKGGPRYKNFDKDFCKQVGLTHPFYMHSLRHTLITNIHPFISSRARKRLSGHSLDGMEHRYQHDLFLDKMLCGLVKWEQHLTSLGLRSDDNVCAFSEVG